MGDSSAAQCDPTDTAPDLTLDVRTLGAVYLGGMSMYSLAAAGLITENSPGSLAAAAPAFGWSVAPGSWETF